MPENGHRQQQKSLENGHRQQQMKGSTSRRMTPSSGNPDHALNSKLQSEKEAPEASKSSVSNSCLAIPDAMRENLNSDVSGLKDVLRQAQTQLSVLQHTQKQLKVQVRNISKHLESEDSGSGKNFFESLFFQKAEESDDESTSSEEPGSSLTEGFHPASSSSVNVDSLSSVPVESGRQRRMSQSMKQSRLSVQLASVQPLKDDHRGRTRANEGKSSSRERVALRMGDLIMLKPVEKRQSADDTEGYVFGEPALRRCAVNRISKVRYLPTQPTQLSRRFYVL